MMKSNKMKKRVSLMWLGALLAVLIFTAACGSGNSDEEDDLGSRVARINDTYLYSFDVAWYLPYAQEALAWDYMEMFGEWTFDISREFRDGQTFGRAMLEEAVRMAAMTVIMDDFARGHGVVLSALDLETIENQIDAFIDEFGLDGFYEEIAADGFQSRAHFRNFFHSRFLLETLLDDIFINIHEYQFFLPHLDMLAAKHILASFENFMSSEEAEGFASALLERIQAGEDFDALMLTYTQDPGIAAWPEGYTFVAGSMVPEFEMATRALEIGEISGLVHSSFGIHIIKRVEPVLQNIMAPHGLSAEDVIIMAIFDAFEEMVGNAEITFLPALDEIEIKLD